MNSKSVLLVANWDWVLHNFRMHLARRLQEEGYNVSFICPPGDYVNGFADEGIRWIPWKVSRRGLNPFDELRSIVSLAKIYMEEQPHIVHHSTIKPNLYGTLAVHLNRLCARSASTPAVLNSFMGIGYVFSDHTLSRALRLIVVPLLRLALSRSGVFTTFSNEADRQAFINYKIVRASNSGIYISEFVDTEIFRPDRNGHNGPIRVFMGARLLWDKGVQEFVDTATRVQAESSSNVEFWLAGEPDKGAPNHVPRERLQAWHTSGKIRWLGHRSDMPNLMRHVDIAFLPTHYNEGTPRFLVEAASAGLPLVSTQIQACERVVHDNENGYTAPTRDVEAFTAAIVRLANDASLRMTFGQNSRTLALEMYKKESNLIEWIDLYNQLLSKKEIEVVAVR